MRPLPFLLILSFVLPFAQAGCRTEKKLATDVTGVRLVVRYSVVQPLEQLRIWGSVEAVPLFGPLTLPEVTTELLDPGEESVVLLLNETLAGSEILFRVDGVFQNQVQSSGVGSAQVVRGYVVLVVVVLGEAAECGNGDIETSAEDCDDGNVVDGDGCSALCVVEPGYVCTGTPSVCVRTCGNGVVEGEEECDDANVVSGDGCSNGCRTEPGYVCAGEPSVCVQTCGNGTLDPNEACDDANATNGDGCSGSCVVEPGWTCNGEPSVCQLTCGNGRLDPNEECDDANLDNTDGCSASCLVEAGWTCNGEPSVCTQNTLCGDGLITAGEACDDGNSTDGDGCSGLCVVEHGFDCTGEPSVCVSTCGDGVVASDEGCDDSNTTPDDGCDANCNVEAGWTCNGEPSVCSQSTCLIVTTADDENDGGETMTPPHQGAGLSLREAIGLANANPGQDCIEFSGSMTINVGPAALPDLTDNGGLHINGQGVVVIDGTATGNVAGFNVSSANNVLAGLEIRNFSGEGIVAETGADNNVIGPGVEVFACGVGIDIGSSGNIVFGSTIRNNTAAGIALAGGSGNEIYLNAIFDNTGSGVTVEGSRNNIFRHDTFHDNAGDGIEIIGSSGPSSGQIVENCIFTNQGEAGLDGGNLAFVVNAFLDFFGNSGGVCDGCTVDQGCLYVDPLYTDAAAGDFTLQPLSPVIDQGVTTGIDVNGAAAGLFNGNAPDMGAFESP